MLEGTMLDGLILLAGGMAVVSTLFGVAVHIRRKRRRGKENLGFLLAREVGGRCIEGPWPEFGEMVKGLAGLGLTAFPTSYVVLARNGDKDVVFFEAGGDESMEGGPVWSGCILRSRRPLSLPMLVFKGDERGECGGEGRGGVPQDWDRVEVREGPLAGYTLASPRVEEAMEMLKKRVARTLARVARAVEGSVLPKCLVFQVVDDRLALYTYEERLVDVGHFLALYRGARRILAAFTGEGE